MGSGSVFCCASRATCSTLTPVDIIVAVSREKERRERGGEERKEEGRGDKSTLRGPDDGSYGNADFTYLALSERARPVPTQRRTQALIRGGVCSRG